MKHNSRTQLLDDFFIGKNIKLPVLKKIQKINPLVPSLTIRANKGLLHYYRLFQDLSINETNHFLYYIEETISPKICLLIFLFLTVFTIAHSNDLSGHPGREKPMLLCYNIGKLLLPRH